MTKADKEKVVPLVKPERIPDEAMLVQLKAGDVRALLMQVAHRFNRPPDKLIKIDEAAAMLGVTTDWLYHHHKRLGVSRQIKAPGLKRGQLRFSVNALQAYIESQKP